MKYPHPFTNSYPLLTATAIGLLIIVSTLLACSSGTSAGPDAAMADINDPAPQRTLLQCVKGDGARYHLTVFSGLNSFAIGKYAGKELCEQLKDTANRDQNIICARSLRTKQIHPTFFKLDYFGVLRQLHMGDPLRLDQCNFVTSKASGGFACVRSGRQFVAQKIDLNNFQLGNPSPTLEACQENLGG